MKTFKYEVEGTVFAAAMTKEDFVIAYNKQMNKSVKVEDVVEHGEFVPPS